MKNYVKRQSPALATKDLDEQRFNDEVWKTIDSLQLKLPSAEYETIKDNNNTAVFTAGQHKGFTLKQQDVVDGLGNPTISASTEITTLNRISNFYYSFSPTLTATARVIFNNCRFDNPVVIANGGRAHFIGCVFANNSFINNAGIAGNVNVIGCIKDPSATHINATIIAQFNA